MAEEQSQPDDRRPELARLPSGRHGLPREFVARNHRERLIAGLAIAVTERGYEATTVDDITRAASVSRRTFYKNFKDKQDCFLAAFDIVSAHLRDRIVTAVEQESEWPERVRAGLAALLSFLSAEPELARLCMVEPILAGGEIASRQLQVQSELLPLFRDGRPERPDGRQVSESVDSGVLGGITSILGARINAGGTQQLPELLPDLLEFTLTPYLGSAEAERLARRSS